MKTDRRECIKAGVIAAGTLGTGVLLNGCSQIVRRYVKPEIPDVVEIADVHSHPIQRLLNRAAFGPRPGEVAKVARQGVHEYLSEQMNPDDQETALLSTRIGALEALHVEAAELGDLPLEEVLRQIEQAVILRAVYSKHQLRERMVDLWSNHFNIYSRKGEGAWFITGDESDVIRKHALGSFPDLLRASAHSPAMLMYLDNQVNQRKDKNGSGANENYARELMELHSLGVHGGYTQKDVQEVARSLTGWTVEERFGRPKGAFRFDPEIHDTESKMVLGHRIPARKAEDGEKDGLQVLDILASHPSTAKFIATKLCKYFLGDAADTWIDKTAATYLATNGDIKSMLHPILTSQELIDGPPIMKRPFDFVISSMRATLADTDGNYAVHQHLASMGQPLYQWPAPDGFPDRTNAWTGTLLARWNFAMALVSNAVGGTRTEIAALARAAGVTPNSENLPERLHGAIFGVVPGKSSINAAFPSDFQMTGNSLQAASSVAALWLCSPQFQWR